MASGDVFRIAITSRCRKEIKKSPKHIQGKVEEALAEIAVNPYHGEHIKAMQGQYAGYYRYRIGNYRLIYEIREKQIMVIAVKFGARGDVYK